MFEAYDTLATLGILGLHSEAFSKRNQLPILVMTEAPTVLCSDHALRPPAFNPC